LVLYGETYTESAVLFHNTFELKNTTKQKHNRYDFFL